MAATGRLLNETFRLVPDRRSGDDGSYGDQTKCLSADRELEVWIADSCFENRPRALAATFNSDVDAKSKGTYTIKLDRVQARNRYKSEEGDQHQKELIRTVYVPEGWFDADPPERMLMTLEETV